MSHIGSQPAWMEQPKRGLAYRRTEETTFYLTTYGRNGILFTGRGLAYRKMEDGLRFDLLRSKRCPVNREGCGIPQNEGNRLLFDLLRSKWGSYSWEGCGVPQNGTPWAIVHPPSTASLQPPRATVHQPSTCSTLHRLLFIQPSMGLVHPPPTGWGVAASSGSCSSSGNRLLPRGLVHPTRTG